MDDMFDTGKNSSVVIGGKSSNSNQPPRYFHDDIGKQIMSIKLDDKNYLAWSQAVRVFLHAKMKQKYLIDDPSNENSPSAETWWSEMSMDDKPLNEHYALLRSFWKELLIYQPTTPNVETQHKQREDFQSSIAYTPSVYKDASVAFVSNGRGGSVRGGRSSAPCGACGSTHGGRGGRGPRPDWLCDYCGNIGHIEPFCYKKNGYPPSVHHASKEPSSNNPQSASTQDDVLSQILHKLNHLTPVLVLPNIDDSSTLGSSPIGSPPSTSLPLSNLVSPLVPMSLPDLLPPPDIVSPSDYVSPSDHVSLPDPLLPSDIVSPSNFVSPSDHVSLPPSDIVLSSKSISIPPPVLMPPFWL
ncbi:hypothetical protein IFM89_014603 [Coptis chinensis]|uniref:Retrotransposon Copia-like N-terminal domain-containing protein n=1 Tax=Coptis chinensis TaxID=261450 RepID=A0A835HEH0_9MAGN|nr:hypothetical protein IFM89_014603 [Coptis chinensis]